jgi:two-component system sensor histidine kinase BarA
MQTKTLRNRLLLLTIIPGFLTSLIATALLLYIFYGYEKNSILLQQHANLDLFGSLITPAFTREGGIKQAELERLGSSTLNLPHIRSVTFLDKNRKKLVHLGPAAISLLPQINPDESLTRFHALTETDETIRHLLPIRSYDEQSSSYEITGWLAAEYFTDAYTLLLYQSLLALCIILLVVVGGTSAFSHYYLKQKLQVINKLTAQLNQLKEPEKSLVTETTHLEELDDLQEAIKLNLSSFANQQQELQENISQSTSDLRETLETIEIQNIELDLARREAVQANKAKSEFLANTSHEIRTPLNGILGFTRLLLKTTEEKQHREYLETILSSSENLLNIINDILDLSKIEAGKLVLDYTPFNIHDLLEEILQILGPGAHEKGLELTHIIQSEVPENLYGDPHRLRQILTNLIANAIKFTDTGSVQVRVQLDYSSDKEALIRISVIDTGIGINTSKEDLFEAFTQAESSSSRQHSGTGLGLAISKKLVEQMGGEIDLLSEPGAGSTFWFTVKMDIQKDSKVLPAEFTSLQGKHILLFDTNTQSLQSLSNILTSWGVKVTITQGIADIIPALTRNASDSHELWFKAVIISTPMDDKLLPYKRLHELALQIREYCPLILYTTTTNKYELETLQSEDTVILTKPVTRRKLFNALAPESTGTDHGNTPSTTDRVIPDHLRVLVVDDNSANLKLAATLLKDLGCNVVEAGDGYKAFEQCKQQAFDLVFMDIQMPGIDGLETTKRIRSLPDHKQTPVIALTAHAQAEQRAQFLASGLNDFLSKPTNEEQLLRMLKRWCLEPASDPLPTSKNNWHRKC